MKAVPAKDEWETMFGEFTYEDLERIRDANLELGYREFDIGDKMDYVNRLSIRLKQRLIEDIEKNKIPQLKTQEDRDKMQ